MQGYPGAAPSYPGPPHHPYSSAGGQYPPYAAAGGGSQSPMPANHPGLLQQQQQQQHGVGGRHRFTSPTDGTPSSAPGGAASGESAPPYMVREGV